MQGPVESSDLDVPTHPSEQETTIFSDRVNIVHPIDEYAVYVA